MAKKPTVKKVKAVSAKSVKAPAKAPKKAVQVKISVKPVKNPLVGEKSMPMIPGKKPTSKSVPSMMKQAAAIGKPKTSAVKPNKGKK